MQKPLSTVHEEYRTAHTQIKKIFGLTAADIVTEKLITISHAYVTFDFWRERNLPKLLHRLEQEAIHSVGRYGSWKYASMQEAVLDGKKIADTLTMMPAQRWYHVPTTQPKQKEFS